MKDPGLFEHLSPSLQECSPGKKMKVKVFSCQEKVNIRKCLPASEKSASEIVRLESESENVGKKVTVKC